MSTKGFEKPARTSKYDENRGSYMDASGNYVYTNWERRGNKWVEVPVCKVPLGNNGDNAEWIIWLDRDDHVVDLQNRYQEENVDYGFTNQNVNQNIGNGNDMEGTDGWASIADPRADILTMIFPEEEVINPQVEKLFALMRYLTEDQINLIYAHFGAMKQLKEICDEENAANGTNKSPQSVGNRKKKIIERLRRLIEKM